MKTFSDTDLAILADGEAAMRYAKLADAAQSSKMCAYYRKCAMEAAIARAIKINQQVSIFDSAAIAKAKGGAA